MSSKVVCRFAPSPSGRGPHIGNLRSCLFSWLFARHHGGEFRLRIEDTNKEKSTQESTQAIFDTLAWLGLNHDGEVLHQSKRGHIYKEYVEKLLASGHAYKCFCSMEELDHKRQEQYDKGNKPKYDKLCLKLSADEIKKLEEAGTPYVVRFNVPAFGGVQWRDTIRARVQVRHIELTDFILQRSDGSVTFLLANMLDDALSGVTHVLRGEDGISHCHPQILLCEALGFEPPQYGHLPFVVSKDGAKLSKRNGDATILDLRDKGFLPEAVINTMARLGWSHGNQEIFTVKELIEFFDGDHINKSAAAYDPEKLLHINQQHIKKADSEYVATMLTPVLAKRDINMSEFFRGPRIADAVKTLQTRSKTLEDMADQITFYYDSDFALEPLADTHKEWLKSLSLYLSDLKDTEEEGRVSAKFTAKSIKEEIDATLELWSITIKDLGPVVRKALSGSLTAPGIVEIMEVLGKEETVKRLERAIYYEEKA